MLTEVGQSWSVLLLGDVEVHDASGQRVLFPGRHSEALFAYLCLEPGKVHTREALAELLWPSQELTSKRTRLRQELTVLRQLLGTAEEGGLLQLTRTTVAVVPERVATDISRFQAAAKQLGSSSEAQALEIILTLYRGALLTGHEELVPGLRREMEDIFAYACTRQAALAREPDPAPSAFPQAVPFSQAGVSPVLHRPLLPWFYGLVPLVVLSVGVLKQYGKVADPPSKATLPATVQWQYLDSPAPGEKTNQGARSSEGTSVAVLPDGRVCAAGLVDTEKEDVDILTVFFSPEGKRVKRHRFSGPGHDCDRAFSVAIGDPKSFYVAGESYFPEAAGRPQGWYLTLLRYDGDGNLLWSRFSSELTHNEDHRVCVIPDGQGGAYLGGTALMAGKRQPLLLHYASDGSLLWSRRVTLPGKEAVLGALCANAQGEVFLAGTASSPNNPNTDWLVAAYNRNGQALWQRTLDGPGQGADRAGAIQVSRFDQVFVAGTVCPTSLPSSVLAVARYSLSGELRGMSQDSEVQPDLRLESAHLSGNGQRLGVAGQFTHADGAVESRVVMFDELGNVRWKLPLVAQKPDRSIAGPRILTDTDGGVWVGAYATGASIFNLKTNGDTLLMKVSPKGLLEETQRFASEDGSPTADLASDVSSAIYQSDRFPPVLVGQRHELGKVTSLQVICLNLGVKP